jgi:hypothetical protein
MSLQTIARPTGLSKMASGGQGSNLATVRPKERSDLDVLAVTAVASRLLSPDLMSPANAPIIKSIEDHAEELAGLRPSPIESAIAWTAALAWGALRAAEFRAFVAQGRTARQAEYDQSQIHHASRRYLSALKTLAQVRKLAGPSVVIAPQGGNTQVNIGGNL